MTDFSHYLEIDLLASQELAQDLVHLQQLALDHYDCLGIEEYVLAEQQVDSILGERSFSGGNLPEEVVDEVDAWQSLQQSLRCKLFFRDDEAAQRFLKMVQKEFSAMQVQLHSKAEVDWAEQWKQNYHPLLISSRLAVIPSWEKGETSLNVPYPVYIYPGRGFGTGGHETTWMCLDFVDMLSQQLSFPRGNVLDFGCGSGILGIAAHKLGWSSIDLYDIDPDALENTVQNLHENFFDEERLSLHCYLPEQKKQLDQGYQLIFANILMNVLLAECSWLIDHLSPGGWLILSGILKEQAEEVISHYHKGSSALQLVAQKNRGDWVSLLWHKNENEGGK